MDIQVKIGAKSIKVSEVALQVAKGDTEDTLWIRITGIVGQDAAQALAALMAEHPHEVENAERYNRDQAKS